MKQSCYPLNCNFGSALDYCKWLWEVEQNIYIGVKQGLQDMPALLRKCDANKNFQQETLMLSGTRVFILELLTFHKCSFSHSFSRISFVCICTEPCVCHLFTQSSKLVMLTKIFHFITSNCSIGSSYFCLQ